MLAHAPAPLPSIPRTSIVPTILEAHSWTHSPRTEPTNDKNDHDRHHTITDRIRLIIGITILTITIMSAIMTVVIITEAPTSQAPDPKPSVEV